MLCSQCQSREAQVFLKHIVHNQVSQRALCHACAQQLGALPGAAPESLLLEVLAGLGGALGAAPEAPAEALHCPTCGLPYARFQATGRLGCADCYGAFEPALSDLLRRLHGSDRHRGKLPRDSREARERAQRADELRQLERALKAAIDAERFEEAARLRDRLQRLQR